MKKLILIMALLISGCSTVSYKDTDINLKKNYIQFHKELYEKSLKDKDCEKLEKLNSGEFSELYKHSLDTVKKYYDCQELTNQYKIFIERFLKE